MRGVRRRVSHHHIARRCRNDRLSVRNRVCVSVVAVVRVRRSIEAAPVAAISALTRRRMGGFFAGRRIPDRKHVPVCASVGSCCRAVRVALHPADPSAVCNCLSRRSPSPGEGLPCTGSKRGVKRMSLLTTSPQTPNKRMQRARDPDKCVLCLQHRRVADARRCAPLVSLALLWQH